MDEPIAQQLSDPVEAAIKEVIALEEDDLDRADFDPIEYINAHFPSEASLRGLDATIAKFELEVHSLDGAIFDTVRAQSTAGEVAAKDLEDAKTSITELFGKIKDIKAKAEQSEVMVQDICVDIRQLDVAKRHLTTTITVLKRLQMLVTAVDRLQANSSMGQYENAGQLLQAVSQLFTNFKDYTSVPKVAELMSTVSRVKAQMQERILRDFDTLTEMGAAEAVSRGYEDTDDAAEAPVASTSLDTLRHACEVVDALEGDMRQRLIASFCDKQLAPYTSMVQADDMRSLSVMDRRFHWFRRTLRDLEARFATVMPAHWRVPHHFTIQFCTNTRRDVEALLSVYTDPDSAPPDALVGALQKTLGFEAELRRRFESGAGAGTGAGGGTAVPASASAPCAPAGAASDADAAQEEWLRSLSTDGELYGIREPVAVTTPVTGIISSAFDPYMGAYVKWERTQLDSLISTASTTSDVDGSSTLPVLRSSPSLFLGIRHGVQRCVKLSTGRTLFKLYETVKDGLLAYCNMLQARLPPLGTSPLPGDFCSLSTDSAPDVCLIINTSEYVADTLPQLADSLKTKVDEAFKEHVDMEDVRDEFLNLTSTAVFRLATGVACMLDPALERLIKTNWTAVEEVGDTSPYVADMEATLLSMMPTVRGQLSDVFFNNFCDKFARGFTTRLMASIYRCKKIGPMGAQQLLLDASAVKTMLLKAPSLMSEEEEDAGAEAPEPAGPMYVKFVTRELPRLELLLKLLVTPTERFASSLKTLWPEATGPELQKVMELRGMSRSQQQKVLDELGLTAASTGGGTMMRHFATVASATKEALRRK